MSRLDEEREPAVVNEDDAAPAAARPYEQPRISWGEPYEPMSFGVSCAKQPGNPPCNSGPTSS